MTTRRTFDPLGVGFGIVLPIIAAVAGLVLTAMWRTRLPAEIIVHWTAGKPDGYSDPTSAAWVFALAIVIVGGGCAGFAALAQAVLFVRRAMLVTGLTVVGLLATLQVTVLSVQLDTGTNTWVQLPSWAIGLGVLIGFLLGAIGATLLRDHRVRVPASVPPSAGLPHGPAVPVHTSAGFGRIGVCLVVVVGLGMAVLGCLAASALWPLVLAVPVIVLVVAAMRYDVTVDAKGVRVRNLGLKSIDLGIDEIVGAKVIDVRPFKDFGGWGLRVKSPARYGVVTHSGPAVEIVTASGLVLTITSSRAEAMAGALNSFAAAQRA